MTTTSAWPQPTTTETLLYVVLGLLTAPVKVNNRSVYPTDASCRVYAPRDWPTNTQDFPDILLSAPHEHKESVGRNQPQFTTTSTIRLLIRFDFPAGPQNAGPVQDKLWKIQRQCERALIGAPGLMGLVQQIAGVRTELGFNSGGERHYGELGMELDLEFFQDAWAFHLPQDVALQEMTVATAASDLGSTPAGAHVAPGLDITLPTS